MLYDDDDRQLTKRQAKACLRIVREWIAAWDEDTAQDVKLYEPGFHADGWTVALEGGPEDWAYAITYAEGVTWPRGVHVETVSGSWCLGLYPA